MLRTPWKSVVTAGLLAVSCTGCSSLPTTVRGQSPELVQQAGGEEQGWKAAPAITQTAGEQRAETRFDGELRGLIQNNQNVYEVSRHGYRTPVGPGVPPAPGMPMAGQMGGTSPYHRWGNFDQQPCPTPGNAGFSQCPPQHQEQCWDHGGRRGAGPYHYHTYRYKQPQDLVYPAPNQPAGVVTYPYYTHKGPSDFFMKTSNGF